MRLPDFELHQPQSLAEAATTASQWSAGEFDWLGGGTDLFCNYKWGINVRPHVVSLRSIPELNREHGGSLAAGRTLWSLENDSELAAKVPALVDAAQQIATPIIRRSATLGGNLLLDTRCWHFNQTEEWRVAHGSCLKAEADVCRVMPDPGDICVATYSGDLAPVLMVYGASVELASADTDGQLLCRTVPMSDFYQVDGIRRFRDKRPHEFVMAVNLPEDVSTWTVSYQKLRLRQAFDFPEGGVAVAIRWEEGRVSDMRLATTAYESVPTLYPELVHPFLGSEIGPNQVDELAEALFRTVRPMKNTSMSPSYRKKMARVLCRRALQACLPQS